MTDSVELPSAPSVAIEPGPSHDIEIAHQLLDAVRGEISRHIFGQESVVELALAAILAGGHALLVGAPGLAKTKLVAAIARVLGADWARIQFTPDLMPSDIIGAEVLEEDTTGKRHFRFIRGPVFTSLLMADEINRASPRTQSALLQAMQEQHVTVAGTTYPLPQPFHVLATQNPIEQEGTYPLPEAQLDRFLLQIDVSFPDFEAERRVLTETTGNDEIALRGILQPGQLVALQRLVRQIPISERILSSVLHLVRSARPGPDADPLVRDHVAWGPSPRAGQALILAARARALLRGRLSPSLDDVFALAEPVLVHRMALNFTSLADGQTVRGLIAHLIERLP